MKGSTKRLLKWTIGITLGVFILICLTIGFCLHFILTPEKLTPTILKIVNEQIDGDIYAKEIELTVFSSFPDIGLVMRDGRIFRSPSAQTGSTYKEDSLMRFKECVVEIAPLAYLKNQRIIIDQVKFETPKIYTHIDSAGVPNWAFLLSNDSSSTAVDTPTDSSGIEISGIEIKKIQIQDGSFIFDDRQQELYIQSDSIYIDIAGQLNELVGAISLDMSTRKIILWKDGKLLGKGIALGVQTQLQVDRPHKKASIEECLLSINGLQLGVKGSVQSDSISQGTRIDMQYGLHVPSLKSLLEMIPEHLVSHQKSVSANGKVLLTGDVKGVYAKDIWPVITAKLDISNGKLHYQGMPYGIDLLNIQTSGVFDLNRKEPSFIQVQQMQIKGANTDINLSAQISNLVDAPIIKMKGKSDIDFTSLAKTFPLEAGVKLEGDIHANLDATIPVKSVAAGDYGRIMAAGEVHMQHLRLESLQDTFFLLVPKADISASVKKEEGKNTITSQIHIKSISFNTKNRLSVKADSLYGSIAAVPASDSSSISTCNIKLKTKGLSILQDSLTTDMSEVNASFTILPHVKDPKKAIIKTSARLDTLAAQAHGSSLALKRAGFELKGQKDASSSLGWKAEGTMGFLEMRAYTPLFPIPLLMERNQVSLSPGAIEVNKLKVQAGKSDAMLTGHIYNLLEAISKQQGTIKARLAFDSKLIDADQLLHALEQGEAYTQNSTGASQQTPSTPSEHTEQSDSLSVFVIPQGIDFVLQAKIKRLLFDKLDIQDMDGRLIIKDQSIMLSNMKMNTRGCDISSTMLYRATDKKKAYTGFDLKMDHIDIKQLTSLMPSLDSLLPMLPSLEGIVDFYIAGESQLDREMTPILNTINGACYLKGKDLVLLDGETFAEISKMMRFKNKAKNTIDSVSVVLKANKGVVEIYPFSIQMDRYKAFVGGKHHMDMSFDYHISLIESPLPFKVGVDVSGNMDDFKYKLVKTRYKNANLPIRTEVVDSARHNILDKIQRRARQSTR